MNLNTLVSKGLSLVLALVMMFTMTSFAVAAEAATIQDGTYSVESTGMYPGLKLDITIEGGVISSVKVVEHAETVGISDLAIESIPQIIAEKNSINVDVVAGATLTSNGIIDGVKAAITMAGGNLEDFNLRDETAIVKTDVEREVDLVIAGAGLTGLITAIAARQGGMSVLVVEKMPQSGGSLSIAGGNFMSVDSNISREYGVDDNKEEAFVIWKKAADGGPTPSTEFPDYERLEYILDGNSDTLDWLKEVGVPFNRASPYDPDTIVKVYTEGGGGAVTKALEDKARELGVEIMMETPATELLVEEGKVVGMKAESPTENLTIRARFTQLSTGGFGKNEEIMQEWLPMFAGTDMKSGVGNTGDAFKMVEVVDAELYDPWAIPSNIAVSLEYQAAVQGVNGKLPSYRTKIIVDTTGVRYVKEDTGIAPIITNALAMRDVPSYVIHDSSNEEAVALLEEGLATGKVFKGDTLADLAEAAGIDADALAKTIATYNTYCEQKEDPDFEKYENNLIAYAAEGPYYAVNYIPSPNGTMGGIVTDVHGHVFNKSGEIVEGLYAVGEVSNRAYYNRTYVGAGSLGLYSTAARWMGENYVQLMAE